MARKKLRDEIKSMLLSAGTQCFVSKATQDIFSTEEEIDMMWLLFQYTRQYRQGTETCVFLI
ncbi:hypothetical protein M6B38_134455 [Iris pallida]|uniref:Uncharacterized protein n=1 Tax=Iris pallida TaxID=29817 RepID=A0AAX6FFW8_IRIPA|nr:hypothetical protein M6B38_134455 [Iris pallida]